MDQKRLTVRIPNKMAEKLEEASKEEGVTVNALITSAIEKYFLKEIIPDELILAKCGIMHHDIEKLTKIADMNGRMFIEFMIYFFLMNPIEPLESDQNTFQLKLNQANKDADLFLEIFRRHLKNGSPAFLEQVLASFLEREVEDDVNG